MVENKGLTLWFYDFALDKKKIFFSAGGLNGLFQADLQTGESRLLGTFSGEEIFGANLYCGTYLYESHILFVPLFGREFAVYDITKKEIFKLQSEVTERNKTEKILNAKFYASIMVEKNVYAFGWDIPEIVCIDMETFLIKTYKGWMEDVHWNEGRENEPYFNRDVCIKDNSLFVAMGKSNAVLELNMDTDRIIIHPIGQKEYIYKTLAYDGKYFWLTDRMKGIVRVNGTNWEYKYEKMDRLSSASYFNSSIFMNQEVWLFANIADNIYRIDCQEFSVHEKEFDYAEGDMWYPNTDRYGVALAKKMGGGQLAILTMQDCMLRFTTSENEIHRVKFYAVNEAETFYEDCWFKHRIHQAILENYGQSGVSDQLRSFLHYIKKADLQESRNKEQTCGDKIYKCLR